MNLTSNPSFCMILAYFRDASFANSSDLAPVQTTLPEPKISAVVLGSLMRIITAAKRLGLYSAFLARRAICLRSRRASRFTVETKFWRTGVIPDPWRISPLGVYGVKGAAVVVAVAVGVGVGKAVGAAAWLMDHRLTGRTTNGKARSSHFKIPPNSTQVPPLICWFWSFYLLQVQ